MSRSSASVAVAAVVLVAGAVVWAPLWQRSGSSAAIAGAATGNGAASATAQEVEGAALFQSKGCATCHDGPDSSASMGNFPSLRAAATWAGGRRAPLSAAEYLADSIRTPGAFTSPAFVPDGSPTSAMPQLELDEREIDAVVAYLLQG